MARPKSAGWQQLVLDEAEPVRFSSAIERHALPGFRQRVGAVSCGKKKYIKVKEMPYSLDSDASSDRAKGVPVENDCEQSLSKGKGEVRGRPVKKAF